MFKIFIEKLVEIVKNNFQTTTNDRNIAEKIADTEELTEFAQTHTDEQWPCVDPKELLDPTLIFLRSTPIQKSALRHLYRITERDEWPMLLTALRLAWLNLSLSLLRVMKAD